MASIYSISDWSAAVTYSINDIVKYGSYYYYSLKNGNLNQTPAVISTYWDGITYYNGVVKPQFFWRPNYNSPISLEPTIKIIKFGDGYEQRVPDGINTKLLKLDLDFSLRTEAETKAISHFLEKRLGSDAFAFTPLPPFDLEKLFVCRNFNVTFIFLDNYSLKARFEEAIV